MDEQAVSVGVRVTDEGLEFFGADEVNEMLGRGYAVRQIEPDEALVEEFPAEFPAESPDEEPGYSLVGFAVRILLNLAG